MNRSMLFGSMPYCNASAMVPATTHSPPALTGESKNCLGFPTATNTGSGKRRWMGMSFSGPSAARISAVGIGTLRAGSTEPAWMVDSSEGSFWVQPVRTNTMSRKAKKRRIKIRWEKNQAHHCRRILGDLQEPPRVRIYCPRDQTGC
jgi:hypothetical protein